KGLLTSLIVLCVAVCSSLDSVLAASIQNRKPLRPVTVNVKGSSPRTGLLVRVDGENAEIEDQNGMKTLIPLERVLSIVFSAEPGMVSGGDDSPMTNILKSLNTLYAATQVGITKKDYDARLIEVKGSVTTYLEKITKNEVKSDISLALLDYEIA